MQLPESEGRGEYVPLSLRNHLIPLKLKGPIWKKGVQGGKTVSPLSCFSVCGRKGSSACYLAYCSVEGKPRVSPFGVGVAFGDGFRHAIKKGRFLSL